VEIPDDLEIEIASHNDREYYCGIREDRSKMFRCILRSRSNLGNAEIFRGSDAFKGDQLSRIFEVKVPPFELCRTSTQTDGRVKIE
jgi:hypothetical protein